jgi:hypothetical protein
MNTDTAFLELDTYSLAGTSNINASRTNFIFRNVNLKNVMGVMWEKYDKFSIRPSSFRQFAGTSNGGSQANVTQTNIKGFDWINCYDEKYGTGQLFMPVYSMNSTGTSRNILPTNNHYCFNFRKGKPVIDIEFQISNLSTNTLPASTLTTPPWSMPEQQFTFIIQPAVDNQNEMGYLGLYTNTTNNPTQYPSKIISNNARVYTYYGFDMRLCCREFWDKYDEFEILLASYNYQGAGVTTNENQINPIALSGFNFMNNFTKAGASSSSSTAIMGITKLGTSGSIHEASVNTYYSPVQFKKTGDFVNFTFEFDNFDISALNGFATLTNRIAYLPFFIRPIKKGLNHQKGLLSISSAGLTTTQTDLGVRNSNFTDITINNVDLRQACESFWDKYNKFNIFLTCMYPNVTILALDERSVNLYCEGLQLDQQMLDSNPQQTTQTWNVGPIYSQNLGSPGNNQVTYGNTHSTTFYKSNDRVNLRFYVKEIGNPSGLVGSEILQGTMTFTIVPVEE